MTINLALPKTFGNFQIRDWEKEDAFAAADLEYDPEIKKYIGMPKGSKEEYLLSFDPKSTRGWPIALLNTNEIIGSICYSSYDDQSNRKELRILVAKAHRGKGIARTSANYFISRIFNADWVPSIVAVVHPDNSNSLGLVRRLGFVEYDTNAEGCLVLELNRESWRC